MTWACRGECRAAPGRRGTWKGHLRIRCPSADLLLLNKIDLISPEALGRGGGCAGMPSPQRRPWCGRSGALLTQRCCFRLTRLAYAPQRRTAEPGTATASARHVSCSGALGQRAGRARMLSEGLRRLASGPCQRLCADVAGVTTRPGSGTAGLNSPRVTLLPPPVLLGRVVVGTTRHASPAHPEAQSTP